MQTSRRLTPSRSGASVPAFPHGRATVMPLVDLSDRAERERLSSAALKGFFRLVAAWNVRDEDARELLGGVSSGSFYEWKKTPPKALDMDRLTRISCLIGIYKALHILYGDSLADRWVGLPNTNALFAGRTPLQAMLGGGIPAMQVVRRLLDARHGG